LTATAETGGGVEAGFCGEVVGVVGVVVAGGVVGGAVGVVVAGGVVEVAGFCVCVVGVLELVAGLFVLLFELLLEEVDGVPVLFPPQPVNPTASRPITTSKAI
jgi:hypothetical protein